MMRYALLCGLLCGLGGCASEPPNIDPVFSVTITVDHDDVVIDDAAVLRASGARADVVFLKFGSAPIADRKGDGVVRVTASNVVLSCEGTLNGAAAGAQPDAFSGTGVRIDGGKQVCVRGLRVAGYKVGLRAADADGLELQDCSFDNLWRMHLKSTKEREHNDDWLWPHENDKQEWVTNYGAAVCIERSFGVKVHGVKVRNGQNGIILDRVEQGMLYDNDCSFLSGWGIAMWRSGKNLISRNALDFCVRGYSHGKYNRGQDSAGLLMFEQCSGNTVVENSITHCGDGVFVFAGKEALGEKKPEGKALDYTRLGCNDNVFARNDLSFAPAHGLEATFSFGNRIEGNTFEENAICGIWGGYSQRTVIRGNVFKGNGQKGYGEGGGINIEHGYQNVIAGNEFEFNSVAVKMWDDDDGALLKTPWAIANHHGCLENEVTGNRVSQSGGAAFLLRGARSTIVATNTGRASDEKAPTVDADAASGRVAELGGQAAAEQAPAVAVGDTRPVGARNGLRGREFIVIGEWGPVELKR